MFVVDIVRQKAQTNIYYVVLFELINSTTIKLQGSRRWGLTRKFEGYPCATSIGTAEINKH